MLFYLEEVLALIFCLVFLLFLELLVSRYCWMWLISCVSKLSLDMSSILVKFKAIALVPAFVCVFLLASKYPFVVYHVCAFVYICVCEFWVMALIYWLALKQKRSFSGLCNIQMTPFSARSSWVLRPISQKRSREKYSYLFRRKISERNRTFQIFNKGLQTICGSVGEERYYETRMKVN